MPPLGSQGDSLASCRTSHSYPFGLWESPLMVGALWRTFTFSENVRHNLAHLCLCSKCPSFYVFHRTLLPNLLICSFWAPWQTRQSTALDFVYLYLWRSLHTKWMSDILLNSSVHQISLTTALQGPSCGGLEIPGSRSEGKGKWSKEGGRSNMMMHTHVSLAI